MIWFDWFDLIGFDLDLDLDLILFDFFKFYFLLCFDLIWFDLICRLNTKIIGNSSNAEKNAYLFLSNHKVLSNDLFQFTSFTFFSSNLELICFIAEYIVWTKTTGRIPPPVPRRKGSVPNIYTPVDVAPPHLRLRKGSTPNIMTPGDRERFAVKRCLSLYTDDSPG